MGAIIDPSEVLLLLGLSSGETEEERAIVTVSIVKAEGAVTRFLRYNPLQKTRTEFYPQQNFGGTVGARWEATDTQAYLRNTVVPGSTNLQVRHIPVRSEPAPQLWIDYDGRSGAQSGSFPDSALKVEGTDYWPNYDAQDSEGNSVCRDGLIRSVGSWPDQAGSVKFTYSGGYTLKELHGQDTIIDASPMGDAIIDESIRRAKKAFTTMKQSTTGWTPGLVISEELGDYSYKLDDKSTVQLFGSREDLYPETMEKLMEFVNHGYDLGG